MGNISCSNGGVNYTVAPVVGFSGPTALNLVVTNGVNYAAAPTITVAATNLVAGTALVTGDFNITVAQGKVVSIYLKTTATAVYSAPPALTLVPSLRE